MAAFASNKQLKVGTRQWGMKVKPTERKPVSALPAFITVYPDPACRPEFALHVIAVMSTRVFSNLIMKCHQQEQTAGKNKLCNNSPHECCNSCSSCVFRVFMSLELHPVLIKADCSFYIITESYACLQHIFLLSLFAAPAVQLQARLPPCYSFLCSSIPL